jgi:glycosyltransferase involved in cell wall biosynthesis
MKKALYIYKSNYPWDVRVEKICSTLSNSGYDVTILVRYSGEELSEETLDGVKIIRFGKGLPKLCSAPFFFNPFWEKAINKTIKNVKPDVVIVREMHIGEISGKLSRRNGVPIFMDMAENYPAAMKEFKVYNSNIFKRFIIRNLKLPLRIERRAIKHVDGVITVCAEQNMRLISLYGIPPERLAVVHNTPQKSAMEPSERNFEKEIFTLGHHGYLTAEKSLLKFIEAFAKYAEHNDNIRLVVAGSGDCLEDYKKILESNGTIKYVNFTGQYKPQELKDILSTIDIGFIPYQISDFNNFTIHNKVFDYWMNGQPVVLSATIPFIRIAEDTKAAMILDCENEESIMHFLENIEFYDWEYMSRNAVFFSQNKYNWSVDSEVLIEFINKFVKV